MMLMEDMRMRAEFIIPLGLAFITAMFVMSRKEVRYVTFEKFSAYREGNDIRYEAVFVSGDGSEIRLFLPSKFLNEGRKVHQKGTLVYRGDDFVSFDVDM